MARVLEDLVRKAEAEWLERWKRGPTRLRWSSLPVQAGDRAPDLALVDQTGAAARLSDFWRERPALLLFWRHYGCGCGLARAERLRQEYPDYATAGAQVVLIGQGEPERAVAYAQKYALPPVPILSDPEFRAYDAFGLLEGQPGQILYDASPELLACEYEAGVALADKRREMGRPLVDNPWQLPGEFVVDREGVIGLAYRYQYCEDFPNPLVLVAAIRAAA